MGVKSGGPGVIRFSFGMVYSLFSRFVRSAVFIL